MHTDLKTLLTVAAFVSFVFATFAPPSKINAVALGLALLTVVYVL